MAGFVPAIHVLLQFHGRPTEAGLTVGLSRDLVEQIVRLSVAAGDEIMKIYNSGFVVESKDDCSPVTAADRAAEDLITRGIRQATDDAFPIVGEEADSEGNIPEVSDGPFWLVDPLDGTKEFINHRDEFTVNIALIEDRRPVLGVVHVPAKTETYIGSPFGAFVRRGKSERTIACRTRPEKGLIAVASRSHRSPAVDDYLSRFDIAESISAGSSLKFCLVAEGKADLYPRFGRTMEWDTAAGHAVLRYAGGEVVTVDGSEFLYAKPGFENPDFIARSRPA
jgi:3'(2'), 5'-bisphosphate nucleotidase